MTSPSIDGLLAALSREGALGEPGPVEVVHTHASVVFLTAQHAIKVKKPVSFWGLLDYSTPEKRRVACEAEIRLNRRLAPEVYLDVVPVVSRDGRLGIGGPGEVVEHAVRMRRWPPGSTLEDHLVAGAEGVTEEVRRTAEALADFHAAHRLPRAEARTALPSAFARVLEGNLSGTEKAVPDVFPARLHSALRAALLRRLFAARGAIRRRVARGWMVDGHGDVRLEHVLPGPERISIVDCVEFNEGLRRIDPLSDLAFLSMDLAAHGRPDLATLLEEAYLARAPDEDAATLLPLYLGYRALVRAAVDERAGKATQARMHLVLAWSFARTSPPPVVLLHGLSGTGKSVLARRIAPWLRAEVLRTDLLRKETGGERADLYSAERVEQTYRAMRARAEELLAEGRSVVLDGTYLRRSRRLEVLRFARAAGFPAAIVAVDAPPEVVRERLLARRHEGTDPSDATWRVYEEQRRTAEGFSPEEEPRVVRFRLGETSEDLASRLADLLASGEGRVD